jgi:hypothetical protein
VAFTVGEFAAEAFTSGLDFRQRAGRVGAWGNG